MKKFLIKAVALIVVVLTVVCGVNYIIDPANMFHDGVIYDAADMLANGQAIESPGDFDEGKFIEARVAKMTGAPTTLVEGSSHIMFIPYEYDDCFVAGLSSSYLGDFYAVTGVFEAYDLMPERVVFGIDPWMFESGYDGGSHGSIKDYAVAKYEIMNGKRSDYSGVSSLDGITFDKVKEITSFSYFQLSIDAIKMKGLGYFTGDGRRKAVPASDPEAGGFACILPNGRRTFGSLSAGTPESVKAEAETNINSGYIAHLGGSFTGTNEDNFTYFKELCEDLQSKGIEVVFYLPSFYPDVYDYFGENPAYAGVSSFEEEIREYAASQNIEVRGSYNPHEAGAEGADFYDWIHLNSASASENFAYIR
ncbi:MAG: hypothetical protein MJ119_02860 [Lachnospiraceae bacterium]|nr:hypothetical protein [Lachnospiraceae bacterium]